ncbi:MAG: hypothetical protein AAEJ04_04405 [Planctomycetota bacterium]
MRYWFFIGIISIFFFVDGAYPYRGDESFIEKRADDKIPVVEAEQLQQIESIARAWKEDRWEDAFLELLVLPGPMRELVIPRDARAPNIRFSERLRDRCWRHIRDRLMVVDLPGGSVAMAQLYPRLERIPIVCAAAGIDPPRNVAKILLRWTDRIKKRSQCDEIFGQAKSLLHGGDEAAAIAMVEQLVEKYPGDRALAAHVFSFQQNWLDEIREKLEQAGAGEDLSLALQLAHRLESICPEDQQATEMIDWARNRLHLNVQQNLESEQYGRALLQLARLLQDGEPVTEELQKLRDQLSQPLRPRIVRGFLPAGWQQENRSMLMVGIPKMTVTRKEGVRSPSLRFGEVGRRWIRSPAHLADVKRWNLLLEEIQELAHLWLHARPGAAALIYSRLSFHASEATRLARRLVENPGQRSRGVWQQWSYTYSSASWQIDGVLPLWFIDEKGREIGQSIEISTLLSSADSGHGGIPVSQREVEIARGHIFRRLDRQVEELAAQKARNRLLETLEIARGLADEGDMTAALELLLPALIGSEGHDQDIRREAATELANWSQLGASAVQTAVSGSSSP